MRERKARRGQRGPRASVAEMTEFSSARRVGVQATTQRRESSKMPRKSMT